MFNKSEYVNRGYNFLHNRVFPGSKRLSSLMLYTTDLCDSACKHCLIWAKRPPVFLSFDKIIEIMSSKCVHPSTQIGLEGGEFLLHPEADRILDWFSKNHPRYDIFSNCLKPEKLIDAVLRYKPGRLYISLDGDSDTYRHMRGKDGYASVLSVIEAVKDKVPVFVMFTLSPYNDFDDLKHVADICEQYKVQLRVGIYNNIAFFDTVENAQASFFGEHKNEEALTFSKAKELKSQTAEVVATYKAVRQPSYQAQIPEEIKAWSENYDYVSLYENWVSGKLRLKCFSILDSVVVLPNGDVPICQNLPTKLGNVNDRTLDEIFNSDESNEVQHHHSENCNQCWVSYHRKYDIILYRNFERYFGKWATSKMLGYYKWDSDESSKYTDVVKDS
ncbi:MAG: radical SAM protein [Chitinophagaceae bacterium]|nr:radical SAM protein [Chitinophagaceae bacterium]